MNDTSPDDILQLKQRLADREREIDHLQAQLDKLRRMNFGSRSEKVSRRIAQMEADLMALQKESDEITGRVDDPEVQRPLRQIRTRKPFPESLPRDEKRLLPAASCCPDCGGSLSYLGEDSAEQLELMRSTFRVIRTVREKHACTKCDTIVQAPAPSHRAGYRRVWSACPGPDVKICRAYATVPPVRYIRPPGCGVAAVTPVGLGGCMLPVVVPAGRGLAAIRADRREAPRG
jgi:transposase